MWTLRIESTLVGTPEPTDMEFMTKAAEIQNHLDTLEGVTTSVITGSAEDKTITFTIISDVAEESHAKGVFISALRTAAHAVGLNTPGWDGLGEEVVSSEELRFHRPELVDA